VLQLAEQAKKYDIGFTMDAEEADRLVMSLRLFEKLALEPSLKGWEGLGLAIQAYQKRTRALIERLAILARKRGAPIQTRLVKGAYWDGEV
jgi:RHH-type proline utilization regulon transcriptional repressor/proline dehydrogenase/delta 1-pyrroline-5-carboxylate dehydrogenase